MGNLILADATADLAGCEQAGLSLLERDRDRVGALQMNNGLTSVVVSLVVLAASDGASSEAEQRLTVEVASAAEEWAIEALSTLRRMVDELSIDALPASPSDRLLQAMPERLGSRCNRHGVLLHRYGCVVCNDR